MPARCPHRPRARASPARASRRLSDAAACVPAPPCARFLLASVSAELSKQPTTTSPPGCLRLSFRRVSSARGRCCCAAQQARCRACSPPAKEGAKNDTGIGAFPPLSVQRQSPPIVSGRRPGAARVKHPLSQSLEKERPFSSPPHATDPPGRWSGTFKSKQNHTLPSLLPAAASALVASAALARREREPPRAAERAQGRLPRTRRRRARKQRPAAPAHRPLPSPLHPPPRDHKRPLPAPRRRRRRHGHRRVARARPEAEQPGLHVPGVPAVAPFAPLVALAESRDVVPA